VPDPATETGMLASGVEPLRDRKLDHLELARRPDVLHRNDTGLDGVHLRHRALPGRSLESVETAVAVLGARLSAPLALSSMTGGVEDARTINCRLADAAARFGIAFGLGSGRRLLEDPTLLPTYYDPDRAERPPLVFANLGASQVRGADGPARAEQLVAMLRADALFVHLNPLQEAIQPEGEVNFDGVLEGIAAIVERLAPLPVGVKEVGFGLAPEDIELLCGVGVAAIDVAGSGGTNWALLEGRRHPAARDAAQAFADWGLPTVVALRRARPAAAGRATLIGSGGLRNGVDAAKCLALGAQAAAFARPALLASQEDRLDEWLAAVVRQLRIATWLTGARSVRDLDESAVDALALPQPWSEDGG
jgi:isopentenyl-diphosphate Delta-isomerase